MSIRSVRVRSLRTSFLLAFLGTSLWIAYPTNAETTPGDVAAEHAAHEPAAHHGHRLAEGRDQSGHDEHNHAHAPQDHDHGHAHEGDASLDDHAPTQGVDRTPLRAAEPPEDPWWHRVQHWLIELLGGKHPHGDEHDHAEDLPDILTATRYTPDLELFLERPPLVVGQAAELLVYLTRLADYSPVGNGEVTVSLVGGSAPAPRAASKADDPQPVDAKASSPSRPGLYRLRLTPALGGPQRLIVAWSDGEDAASFELAVQVAGADARNGAQAGHGGGVGHHEPEDGRGDGVQLTKEQQWRSDFATAPVERRVLRGSVPATGLLRPSADGEAHVTSPIDGHLRGGEGGFPYTGMPVEAGRILAYLVPQLGGEADVAGLELAVTRAETGLDLARQERERLDALWEDRSVPFREVLQARGDEAVAGAELTAARRRLAQVRRTEEGEGAGVPIRAPIAGVVARVDVAPGAFVEEGARLFHLVDPQRLWLVARVAESDLMRIRRPAGAWFQVPGRDADGGRVFELTPGSGARLVAFGAMIDPESRTVPVIYELERPSGDAGAGLHVGQSVSARVYTGEVSDTLVLPAGALVNDAGADVVYVQTAGDRFERRLVRTGLRDGGLFAVHEGVREGERVVSRGAYLVHLAAGAEGGASHHGHAH